MSRMDKKKFNAAVFKETLKGDWDRAAAGWEKWWGVIEKGSIPVSKRLLELSGVEEGSRVLDIATGIGEPAISAAKKVGKTGSVVAVDFSECMLEIARKRAKEQGAGNIEFFVMDAEALRLARGGFDAVLCRWGLMFFPEPSRAMQLIAGLLKEGGRFAAAVWDSPEKVPMISLPMGVVRKELRLPPPPPDRPTPFSLADRARLEKMLRDAGFRDVATEGITVTLELPSPEVYCDYIKDVAGPVTTLLKEQTEERKACVWRAVMDACRRFETPGGGIRMENSAILVSGRK